MGRKGRQVKEGTLESSLYLDKFMVRLRPGRDRDREIETLRVSGNPGPVALRNKGSRSRTMERSIGKVFHKCLRYKAFI